MTTFRIRMSYEQKMQARAAVLKKRAVARVSEWEEKEREAAEERARVERKRQEKEARRREKEKNETTAPAVDTTIRLTWLGVLGLTGSASVTEIRSTYLRLVLLYHPDKNPDPEAVAIFRRIREAYEALCG